VRVFICWSGDRSQRLAGKLAEWLPKVIGADVICDLSLKFMPGKEWFPQLKEALSRSSAAVVCFTPENLSSLWMHFEAGAVFAASERRVLPYYLGSDAARIKEPLNAIQAITATEDGTRRLVKALAHRDSVEVDQPAERFDHFWPELHQLLRDIETPRFADLYPDFERLFQRKTFYEPIDECSDQVWLDRYDAARDTLVALRGYETIVRSAARPWQVWLFEKLLGHVDAYARLLRVYLLVERGFKPAARRLDFSSPRPLPVTEPLEALPALCEHRCREIRHAVFCLTRHEGTPVFADEALAFAKLSLDAQDDKKRLVHRKESEIERRTLTPSPEDVGNCARSFWSFDRVVYYLLLEQDPKLDAAAPRRVSQEVERLNAGDEKSAMPLHYALRALRRVLEKDQTLFDRIEIENALAEVEDFLKRFSDAPPEATNRPIRKNLEWVRERMALKTTSSP
jgi:TIR domain